MTVRTVFAHRPSPRPNDPRCAAREPRPADAVATAVVALFLAVAPAEAGTVWTDANGDGLPDSPGTLVASAGDVVSVDLWIDSQSFTWTNFLVYAEWVPGCFQFVSGEYIVTGGQNFPLDTFSNPSAIGFGGVGYSRQGVDAMVTVNVRALTAGVCCVTPIIDLYNPYYTFCQLGSQTGYLLFTSNPNSCWTVNATPQACCFPDESCSMLTPDACTAAGGTPRGFGTDCGSVFCEPPPPRGACCMTSGACADQKTPSECAASGGVYQGDDTNCASVSCPLPTGACCFADGSCQSLTATACGAAGGNYRGDFTNCATIQCPPPNGACCLPTGECVNAMTEVQCTASGGAYQGNGVLCSAVTCPQPARGACCFANGACSGSMTAAQCATAGGAYQGDGTDCASVDCAGAVGACCYPSGACVNPISAAECASGGGVYQGDDTICQDVSCPQPVGACCFADASCQMLTSADCSAAGGDYRGSGTSCALVDCAPPEGACCLADGSCALQSAAGCTASGGEYAGDGTTCAAVNCAITGGCCLAGGSCVDDYSPAQCQAAGGVYLGDGETCAATTCGSTRIWTDANFDGLPDTGPPFIANQGQTVSFDIWIDSQGFQWSNYLAYVEWPPGCMSFQSAQYFISGGSNFPADDFSNPNAVGLGGSGFDEIGIDRLGRVNLRADALAVCCVTPIIDVYNPFYTFSQLGSSSGGYRLFATQIGSCWSVTQLPGYGACCYPSGACEYQTEIVCASFGGVFQGEGTLCGTADCPQPGACCVPGFGCAPNNTAEQCAALGGVFLGEGSTCGPYDCFGSRIWTDANGDGLPDTVPLAGILGDEVSVDLWVDSQGFAWTNYLAYVEWPASCMSYVSAEYLITGGSNFPIDDFSHPSGIGFGGNGYDEIGIDRIGRVRVRLDAPVACCVTPIVDASNPFYVFSQLGNGPAFDLFDNSTGSCWETTPPPPTGACCFYAPRSCSERTEAQCASAGGVYVGDGTTCATDSCPPPTGACCVNNECVGELTQLDCEAIGGTYRGDATRCTTPNICVPPPPCPPAAPGATGALAMKESVNASARRGAIAAPCALPASTNGNAANYRWYNVCSGYIWIYNNLQAGEGVGVLFGGPSQWAVNGDNDVKRVITYFRNVCPNYNQTVDVFVDVDVEGDGCPNANLGTDLDIDPGLRWNCSDFAVSIPCGVTNLIVRARHDGGASPSFATDGPFTATCDPNAPGRSYYYGVNGSACIPWRGADGTYDNFLFWLILDTSYPCVTAVEPTSWGKIKGLFR